jgi:hypothetical protein
MPARKYVKEEFFRRNLKRGRKARGYNIVPATKTLPLTLLIHHAKHCEVEF